MTTTDMAAIARMALDSAADLRDERDRARDIAAHLEAELAESDLRADLLRARIRDLEDEMAEQDELGDIADAALATIALVKACLLQGGQAATTVRQEAISILMEQP